MPSPYLPQISQLVQDLDRAFVNEFRIIRPFQSEDILPGERYGLISFETLDTGRDRFAIARNRAGAEAAQIRYLVMLTVGVDCADASLDTAQLKAEIAAMEECFNLDHGLSAMGRELRDDGYGFVESLECLKPIDRSLSQSLRDPSIWVVTLTCSLGIRIVLNKAIDGTHISPLGARQ